MSRTPAQIRQADVARVARVAKSLGPEWRVEIDGSTIRLMQGDAPPTQPVGQGELLPRKRRLVL